MPYSLIHIITFSLLMLILWLSSFGLYLCWYLLFLFSFLDFVFTTEYILLSDAFILINKMLSYIFSFIFFLGLHYPLPSVRKLVHNTGPSPQTNQTVCQNPVWFRQWNAFIMLYSVWLWRDNLPLMLDLLGLPICNALLTRNLMLGVCSSFFFPKHESFNTVCLIAFYLAIFGQFQWFVLVCKHLNKRNWPV